MLLQPLLQLQLQLQPLLHPQLLPQVQLQPQLQSFPQPPMPPQQNRRMRIMMIQRQLLPFPQNIKNDPFSAHVYFSQSVSPCG